MTLMVRTPDPNKSEPVWMVCDTLAWGVHAFDRQGLEVYIAQPMASHQRSLLHPSALIYGSTSSLQHL
jgi:hypothetical protein